MPRHQIHFIVGRQVSEKGFKILPILTKEIKHFLRRFGKVDCQIRVILTFGERFRNRAFTNTSSTFNKQGACTLITILPFEHLVIELTLKHRQTPYIATIFILVYTESAVSNQGFRTKTAVSKSLFRTKTAVSNCRFHTKTAVSASISISCNQLRKQTYTQQHAEQAVKYSHTPVMKQPTACLFVKSVKILRVGNRIVHISQATTASWNDIKN